MKQLLLEQLGGNIGWKDRQLRHLGCNANLAATLRLRDPEQIVGLRDADLPISEDNAEFYLRLDQAALQGESVQFIHLYQASYFLINKKPLFDAHHTVSGVIYHCQPLHDASFIRHLSEADKKFYRDDVKYQVAPQDNRYNLSKRELQCLFHLLRGKTAKQIASVLGLSKRTIDFYIENIKNKFGCPSKAELIVAAIEAGYQFIIP